MLQDKLPFLDTLFKGKRKYFTIPFSFIILFKYFFFILGGGLSYFVYKKIKNQKLRNVLIASIIFITLPIGSAWMMADYKSLKDSNKIEYQEETIQPEVAGILVAQPTSSPNPTLTQIPPSPTPDTRQLATLIKVIDGDTISVSIEDKNETIRIIGIDTPEVNDSRKNIECMAYEATKKAKSYFEETGNRLYLESDPTQGDRDKYQRLLRYVFINEGFIDFGKSMLISGYASEYTYNIPYKYQEEYIQAEKTAYDKKLGLWSGNICMDIAKPTIAPTQQIIQNPPTQPPNNIPINTYDANNAYSGGGGGDKDCVDFSSHAEAQAYFESKGGSPTNNVDRLDADHDGLACESLP